MWLEPAIKPALPLSRAGACPIGDYIKRAKEDHWYDISLDAAPTFKKKSMWDWFSGTQVRVVPVTHHEDNELKARFSVQVGAAVVVRA